MIPDRAVTVAIALLAVISAIELAHVMGNPGETFHQSLALVGLVLALGILASELAEWQRDRARDR